MSTGASQVSPTESWTIARVLDWAGQDFKAKGLESPRLDAELLLGHVLGLSRIKLIMEAGRPLVQGELSAFRELVRRRRRHEPVAYILGYREMYGLRFRVDPRVLIPRPDTEALVGVALRRTQRHSQFGNALDLCTGSGCVAIAFAHHRPTWRVTGTDDSAGALALARENALRLGTIWGVSFSQGDLFQAVPGQCFDLITANPPYIPSREVDSLDPTIRDFEPRSALDGGANGLILIEKLVAEAPRHLHPRGILALEVAYDQSPSVLGLMERAGFTELETERDYGGHERVISGRFSGS